MSESVHSTKLADGDVWVEGRLSDVLAARDAVLQEERELRRTAMDRVEALEVALGVVIEEIEGGDLQYAVSFAKEALRGMAP